MILYHGTNTEFEQIDLKKSKPNKDFGQGFYISADREYEHTRTYEVGHDEGAYGTSDVRQPKPDNGTGSVCRNEFRNLPTSAKRSHTSLLSKSKICVLFPAERTEKRQDNVTI